MENVLKSYVRMCKSQNGCSNCLLGVEAEKNYYYICQNYILQHFDEATKIITKWAKEHPVKTRMTDFLEKYPNAPISETDEVPDACAEDLGYCKECHNCCTECWNAPLED